MLQGAVTVRFTKEEHERIKNLSSEKGSEDVTSFLRDIIRRELGIQPIQDEDVACTQPPLSGGHMSEIGGANAACSHTVPTEKDNRSRDTESDTAGDPACLASPSSTKDSSPTWFSSHLAKLDRDCSKTQSRADKLKSDLDMVQAVFHKSAAESLKITLDTKERIQTILEDANKSFLSSKEEMRTDMESLFKKMQLTFEQTASNGMRLMKQMQETGSDLLDKHLKRSEETVQKELQAFNKTHTLMKDDLNSTRNDIEGTFKRTEEGFTSMLNPAISLFKKFKAETLKLKKTVWFTAVFAALAVAVPSGGWLVYQYERERFKAEMWERNAQRMNHYIMKNFYPGLDTDGKTKINEYYSLFDLTTPEEQKGALE